MQPVERALWDRLAAAGVAPAGPPVEADEVPWFIALMLGIAAWFAAWCLMAFLAIFLSGAIDNGPALLVMGLACCVAAVTLLRGPRRHGFRAQFIVPFGLVGQGLVVFGLVDSIGDVDLAPIGVSLLVVCGAMAALVEQSQHRFLSTLGASVGLCMMLVDAKSLWLATPLFAAAAVAYWWLMRESGPVRGYLAWRPAGHAINLALLIVAWFAAFGDSMRYEPSPTLEWMRHLGASIPLALLLLFVMFSVLRKHGVDPASPRGLFVLALTAVLSLLLQPAPGVLAALLLVVLGFSAAEMVVIGFAVIALVGYLGLYYYQLQLTLLAKSFVLMASGALLLAGAFLERRFVRSAP